MAATRDTANDLARSAWLIAGLSVVALGLSVVWNLLLAGLYGAGGALDSFWVAFAVPKAVIDSFHLGLLAIVFIAVFGVSESWLDVERRWRVASSVLNVVVVCTVALVVLLVAAAPALVRVMGPGLDASHSVAAAAMLRLLALVLLCTVLTGGLVGILNAHQRFLPFALVRVIGLSVQALLLLAVGRLLGIQAAVWAVLVGGVAMLLSALVFMRRSGFRYSPSIDFRGAEARSVRHLFASLATLSALVFVNQASDRFFASFQGAGSISALEFAWRFEIPITQIASFSVALPAFAMFALHASTGELGRFREAVAVSIRLVALIVLPMVAFLVILRVPLTALWFERGEFGPEATRLVASLLPILAVVYVCRSFATILVFGLICARRAGVLVGLVATEVAVNTALNALLAPILGVRGIVIATAAAMLTTNVVLWAVFARSLGGFAPRRFAARAGKIALVNGVAAVALLLVRAAVASRWADADAAASIALVAACATLFGAVYLAMCQATGLIEIRARRGRLPRLRLKTDEWGPQVDATRAAG